MVRSTRGGQQRLKRVVDAEKNILNLVAEIRKAVSTREIARHVPVFIGYGLLLFHHRYNIKFLKHTSGR